MLVICFTPDKIVGGYGDRIIGLLSVRMLSKALGRDFYILWNKENIRPYINYAKYDYERLEKKGSEHIRWLIDTPFEIKHYLQSSAKLFDDADATLFYVNYDMAQYLYTNPLFADINYPTAILGEYQTLYTDILVPTDSLMGVIDRFTADKVNIIGIQIRCGDIYIANAKEPYCLEETVTRAHDILTAIKNRCCIKYPTYSIFLTTDYDEIYTIAKTVWDPSQIIYNSDPIQHIDRPIGEDTSKVFIDNYILSQRTIELYISDYSNYGRVAALSCVHSNIYNLNCSPLDKFSLTNKGEQLFKMPSVGVTFVTALYLPAGPMFKPVDTYFEQFEWLAATGVPLIVYLDARLADRGAVLCERFPNILRCEYVTLDTSWVPSNVLLPYTRREEKDTIEYFCIQLSKLRLLHESSTYVKTSHVAWIDFGIYYIFKNPNMVDKCLKIIAAAEFPTNKIMAAGCWPLPHELGWDRYDVWNSICWRFCGGFLLGATGLFAAAAARQESLVMGNLPGLTWEVNYWAMMEEHFTNYRADHDDSIIANVCQFIVPQKN